jgi:hypothetical protein
MLTVHTAETVRGNMHFSLRGRSPTPVLPPTTRIPTAELTVRSNSSRANLRQLRVQNPEGRPLTPSINWREEADMCVYCRGEGRTG